VLYLGGSGRSGTTLIARVIGQLPGYVAVGEVREIWRERSGRHRLCGCGLPFDECPFWQRVGDEAFGGWSTVDRESVEEMVSALNWRGALGQLRPGADRGPALPPPLAELLSRLYAGITAAAGNRTIVDTSKGPPYGVALSLVGPIDLRAVQVVRDIRGITYSWCKEVKQPATLRGRARSHKLAAVASSRWLVHNSVMEILRRRVPSAELRYERFVSDARTELMRVMGDLGVPVRSDQLEFLSETSVTLGVDHTLEGNDNRHAIGEVPLRVDDAWRRGLPLPLAAQVTAMTWPMLVRYGYA